MFGGRRRSTGVAADARRTRVNRILIVKLGALGDVVHAIPVAAALRRAFPSARIDWLVGAEASRDPRSRARHRPPPGHERLEDARPPSASCAPTTTTSLSTCRALSSLRVAGARVRRDASRRIQSRYARERLAQLVVYRRHDPGGGGMYHIDEAPRRLHEPRRARNARALQAGAPEFPIDRVSRRSPREVMQHDRRTLRDPESRRGMAEQAVDARALAAIAWSCARATRSARWSAWGPGEESMAERSSTIFGRRAACRRRRRLPMSSRLRAARRFICRATPVRRTSRRPSARRSSASTVRRGRHATVRGRPTTSRCRARSLRVPSPAAMPPGDDVSGGHSGRRSGRSRGAEARRDAPASRAFRVALGFVVRHRRAGARGADEAVDCVRTAGRAWPARWFASGPPGI